MITSFFGVPGCGKTTFATKLAQSELKKIKKGKSRYKRVYTNFFCFGCYQIDYNDLGSYLITDSLIILDEITLDADSRNFKEFGQEKKEFFILHRHMYNDIYILSQQYNGTDKKIRDLTQELYFLRGSKLFTIAKKIYRCLDINEMSHEVVEGYRFPKFLETLFTRRNYMLCFRPKYYKYFNSFELPTHILNLPLYNNQLWNDTIDFTV